MTRIIGAALLLMAAVCPVFAEIADTPPVNNVVSVDTPAVADTLTPADTPVDVVQVDIDNTPASADTPVDAVQVDIDNTEIADDMDDDDYDLDLFEAAVDTAVRRAHPNLVAREHEYRRQTRLAVAMMILIAVAFATSQSWNPR